MNPEGDMTGSAMSGRAPVFRGSPVRRVHVMVKPTGARCNLNCTYCYYLSKEQLLGKSENGCISDELLEEFIRQYRTQWSMFYPVWAEPSPPREGEHK